MDGAASATVDGSLPPLEQAEQLSILIDIAQGMLFCYTQEPPVQHRCFLRIALHALAANSAIGVFGRDLKPQNVLGSSSHECWILADFGIAKASDSALTSTFTTGGRGFCYRARSKTNTSVLA